jgi:hypothetical protein
MNPLHTRLGKTLVLLAVAAGVFSVVSMQNAAPRRITSPGAAENPVWSPGPMAQPSGRPAASREVVEQGGVRQNAGGAVPESRGKAGLPPTLGQFDQWSRQYLEAAPTDRSGLVERGVQLAQARRKDFKRLIAENPARALENAVPMVVRQQLPAPVLAQLEERVSTRGFYGVLGSAPAMGSSGPGIRRQARMADGTRYEVFTFGARLRQATTENAFLSGVALDRSMALDERRLRVLEKGEIPDPAKPMADLCPVSGKSTPVTGQTGPLPPINAQTPAVEIAGTVHFLCSGGHIRQVEEGLVAQEGGSGGATKPVSAPSSWTLGARSLLYMRVAFPGTRQEPQTEAAAYAMLQQVNDFFAENSYGALYVVPTVTPLLIMPRSEAWYSSGTAGGGDEFDLRTDALEAARQAGYDPNQFDLDILAYAGGPGSFGGLGYVGGKGTWLKSLTAGVACHELGHNLGVWHANFWNTSGRSVIAAGTNQEYGNPFDTMGNAVAGDYHFNTQFKSQLGWLPQSSFAHTVTAAGTYRVYAHDQARLDPLNRYALVVAKDSDREYWAEFRQKSLNANKATRDGLVLHWSPWASSNNGSQILDTTPGSPSGTSDAPLLIGRTFSDPEAGIHITPVGKAGTTPESVDVVVQLGAFPGNQPPTVSIAASSLSVGTGVAVNWTATASDPEGDALSYSWDFGDKTFSNNNAPGVSKSWSVAGEYVVRCVVSDMKGGTASQSRVVRVGSPNTFTVSGRASVGGLPLANVRIHNGLTGNAYREAFTDSDGSYTLCGLAAGNYTVGAALNGYGFTAGFVNPVTVGPHATGADFTASPSVTVTLAANDAAAAEGNVDKGQWTLTRTGATANALTVNFLSPSGSAVHGTDYSLAPALGTSFSAIIPAGQSTLNLVLTATDDAAAEGPEQARLELLPGTAYEVAGLGAASIVIQDNDTALPVVSLAVPTNTATETGTPGVFTVSRTGPVTQSLLVKWTISGSATTGVDFTSIGTQGVIPAGQSSANFVVAPILDGRVEGTETVTLTLASDAAYLRAAGSASYSGTVNLLDADIPTVTVTATDGTAGESGADLGVFELSRTGNLTEALTVHYALSGSALHGVDYAPLAGVATIPAGSATTSLTVAPVDDALGEAQQTLSLHLRSGTGYVVGTQSSATIQIADGGDVPVITVGVLDAVASEPSGTGSFRFTSTGSGTGTVTVRYTVSGTATAGVDYTALSGSFTMARNSTYDLVVTPLNDAFPEDVETVTVTLAPDPAYTLFLDTSATLSLQDDEQPSVSVSTVASDSFSENGGTGKFWISRTGSTTGALTVNYTLSGTATAGVDYQAVSSAVTVPAGQSGVAVSITAINDALAEGTETVVLTLAPGSYGFWVNQATLYLLDDETPSVQVRFANATGTGSESLGVVQISVELSAASANAVTVEYFIGGGTATGGVDYQIVPGRLTFAPGETLKHLALTLVSDPYVEPSQTVILKLRYAQGAALGTSTFTYTIQDGLAPLSVGFAASSSSGSESAGSAPLRVTLSRASETGVSVQYAVTGGSAVSGTDYQLNAGTLSFAPGETSKVIPNTIIESEGPEWDETLVVALSNPAGAVLGNVTVQTHTIVDGQTAVSLTVSDDLASESGSNPGVFTLSRTGSLASPFTVQLERAGTATPGIDYQALPLSATFQAGQATTQLSVLPIDDPQSEPSETIVLTLLPGAGYTVDGPASATVVLIDNDGTPPVIASVSDQTLIQNGERQVYFTVNDAESVPSQLLVTAFCSDPGLFPNLALAGTTSHRTLTLRPAPNASGTATITLTVADPSGGTASTTFGVTVWMVNSAPSFVSGPDIQVREDAGLQTMPGWATRISPGLPGESGQLLQFVVACDSPWLFSVPPSVTREGTLVFRTAPDVSGTTRVSVQLRDNGGSAYGGSDTSPVQTFSLEILAVNDPPTFLNGPDIRINPDAGALTFPGWASQITVGPADEANQGRSFQVSVLDHPEYFSVPPAVSPTGTLTFTPVRAATGMATLQVQMFDDGGTAHGGIHTSQAHIFSVHLSSFASLAGSYSGLIRPSQDTPLTHARTGLFQAVVSKMGAFSGSVVVGGARFAIAGVFDQTGVARFGREKSDAFRIRQKGLSDQVLRLQIDMTLGSHKLRGQLTGDTDLTWEADRAVVPSPNLAGAYTVIFPAKNPALQGRDSTQYPQGHGVGTLAVLNSGGVRLSGTLADGSVVSFSGALSKENTFAFHALLASGKGSISGQVGFRENAGESDCDARDLVWFNPANPLRARYPAGWMDGIRVDLLGSLYQAPTGSQSVLPDLGPMSDQGNALVELSGGGLPVPGIRLPVHLTPSHTVRVVTLGPEALSLVIRPATGLWSGSFVHPMTRRRVPVTGVIFQKTSTGAGFLLGPGESGPAFLTPQTAAPK